MNTDERFRMRAYDKINNEMHYNYQRMWIDSGNEEEIPSGLIFNSDLHKHNFDVWPPDDKIDRILVEMDWVHAVDEFGMPIYVADLVKVNTEGIDEWIGVVQWGADGCAICFDINSFNEEGKCTHICYFDKNKTKFNIIGNIYENADMVAHLIERGVFKI